MKMPVRDRDHDLHTSCSETSLVAASIDIMSHDKLKQQLGHYFLLHNKILSSHDMSFL